MNHNILVIGIAGGTGSGKTTLMRNLIAQLGDEVTVLRENYYVFCNCLQFYLLF